MGKLDRIWDGADGGCMKWRWQGRSVAPVDERCCSSCRLTWQSHLVGDQSSRGASVGIARDGW